MRPSTGVSSGEGVVSTTQAAGVVAGRGAGDAARDALERRAAAAAGQPHALGDARDRADLRVLALVARHEQHLVGVADVDRAA